MLIKLDDDMAINPDQIIMASDSDDGLLIRLASAVTVTVSGTTLDQLIAVIECDNSTDPKF